MMSYLFIGALLIVESQSQFPECNTTCTAPTTICDITGTCVEPCTGDDDCLGRATAVYTPRCDETSGQCIICKDADDCINSAVFTDTEYCISGGPLFDGNVCSDEPAQWCSQTAECTQQFGETFICIEYTSDTATDFGVCVNASDAGVCDPTQADPCADGGPFGDESEFFAELDVSCQDLSVPANLSGTIYSATLSFCVPDDQCTQENYKTQCITGAECREFNFDQVFGFSLCMFANTTCSSASDCETGLECYEKDEVCYLPCTSSDECRTDAAPNWACGIPPNVTEDIQACLPLGFENATYLTYSPTTSPVGGPGSGVKSLQIFAAAIIMIINSLFN